MTARAQPATALPVRDPSWRHIAAAVAATALLYTVLALLLDQRLITPQSLSNMRAVMRQAGIAPPRTLGVNRMIVSHAALTAVYSIARLIVTALWIQFVALCLGGAIPLGRAIWAASVGLLVLWCGAALHAAIVLHQPGASFSSETLLATPLSLAWLLLPASRAATPLGLALARVNLFELLWIASVAIVLRRPAETPAPSLRTSAAAWLSIYALQLVALVALPRLL